ncbi:MAG: SGNH/GDSL hydrolase family protein [Verrucomicrobiota bacterium]
MKHPLAVITSTLSLLSAVCLGADSLSILPKDGRLAVVGDSITEQKLYSKFIETYLLTAGGRPDVHVFQFGWGGETAGGFDTRLKNDLGVFSPNVVTLCYGMNDGTYRPYENAIGKRYEDSMRSILKKLTEDKIHVVVGTPGAVDSKFFARPFPANMKAADSYNESLAKLGDIGKKLAAEFNEGFADIHGPMMDAMVKAKAANGDDFDVCGRDGVHPGPNGHLAMAYAFLKGLGCDGNVGEIVMDASGKTTVSAGHKVVTSAAGTVELESERYPFCFDPDSKSSGSTRSLLAFLPFNQDLNRLTLKVAHLTSDNAKVTWGEESREFTKAQLEAGVNLAAEFTKTPFDKAFGGVMNAVAAKQAYETMIIKGMISQFRAFNAETQKDPELGAIFETLRKKFLATHSLLDSETHAKLVPVKHTLTVTPL